MISTIERIRAWEAANQIRDQPDRADAFGSKPANPCRNIYYEDGPAT